MYYIIEDDGKDNMLVSSRTYHGGTETTATIHHFLYEESNPPRRCIMEMPTIFNHRK